MAGQKCGKIIRYRSDNKGVQAGDERFSNGRRSRPKDAHCSIGRSSHRAVAARRYCCGAKISLASADLFHCRLGVLLLYGEDLGGGG